MAKGSADSLIAVISKQSEIIDELTKLNVEVIELLSQHMSCEQYERELEEISSRRESEV